MCVPWGTAQLPRPRSQVGDPLTYISSCTLIFMQYLLFIMATPIKPALQRYDVIGENVGPFDITALNNLELVIHMVFDRYRESLYFP